MDLLLAGRRALVCGASRGIGAAIAEALVAEGARVALAARQSDSLASQAIRLGAAPIRSISLRRRVPPLRLIKRYTNLAGST